MFTGPQLMIVLGLLCFAVVAAIVFSRFAAASEETMREIRDLEGAAASAKPVRPPHAPQRRR
jgi:hypothetical protein